MNTMTHPIPAPVTAPALAASRVLVVGDVMLDRYWYGAVDRISPEAPVPVVRVTREEERGGGAANVAGNIAALGAHAALLAVVGDDEASQHLEALLAKTGIQTHFGRDAELKTTVKLRVIGRQQQLLRIDFEEKPGDALVDALHAEVGPLLAAHDVMVLSDYAKGALVRVHALIAMARERGIPVLVDPKGSQYERYRGATIVTPNRTEMQQAVGHWNSEDDLMARAQRLRESLGLEALLVTRSEQGMTLFTAQGRDHVDAQAHEVFDVSGAGDTVLATLAVMRGAGIGWPEAMRWANRAGGIVVGKLGTSVVTAGELA